MVVVAVVVFGMRRWALDWLVVYVVVLVVVVVVVGCCDVVAVFGGVGCSEVELLCPGGRRGLAWRRWRSGDGHLTLDALPLLSPGTGCCG